MPFLDIGGEILLKFMRACIALLGEARSLFDDQRYCGDPLECSQ